MDDAQDGLFPLADIPSGRMATLDDELAELVRRYEPHRRKRPIEWAHRRWTQMDHGLRWPDDVGEAGYAVLRLVVEDRITRYHVAMHVSADLKGAVEWVLAEQEGQP